MAGLNLLDGTNVVINEVITLAAGTVSVSCFANYLSCDFTRAMLDKTTFCNTGWTGKFPSLKSLDGRIEGFANKGLSISDPLNWFADQTPRNVLFTADTGCTLTGNAFCSADHIGFRAAANSERGINFTNDGPWTSVWVIV